jgi:hypothetical protein
LGLSCCIGLLSKLFDRASNAGIEFVCFAFHDRRKCNRAAKGDYTRECVGSVKSFEKMSLGLSYRQAGWPLNKGWDPRAAKFRILKDHPSWHYNSRLRLGADLAAQPENAAAKASSFTLHMGLSNYENPSILFPSSTCRIALRFVAPRQQRLACSDSGSGGNLGRLP